MSELYFFQGQNNSYGFVPKLTSVLFNSVTYAPTIIKRSNLRLEENFARSDVTFTFRKSHFYAKELLTELPETPILVTIFKYNGSTYIPYWYGRVAAAKTNVVSTEIICNSIYSSLRRGGVSPKITMFCRHILYSDACGVSKGLWGNNYTATPTSSEILISGLAEDVGYYNNGIAYINGFQRRILHNTASHIYVAYPFPAGLSGTITLYPGCKLTEGACTAFNNLDNFGGFSHIPGKNPFDGSGLL
jgi:hypothetical protein